MTEKEVKCGRVRANDAERMNDTGRRERCACV